VLALPEPMSRMAVSTVSKMLVLGLSASVIVSPSCGLPVRFRRRPGMAVTASDAGCPGT